MSSRWVEIVTDTLRQLVKIVVYQKNIATRLHARNDTGNKSGSDGQLNQLVFIALA